MKTSDFGKGRKGERGKGREGERGKEQFFSPSHPLTLSPSRLTRSGQHARFIVWLLLLAAAPGCAYYSFTGATVPAHLNTVAIPLAEDNSLSPLTTLDDELTDLLITRFVQQTRLGLEQNEDDADAVLTIRIDRYANAPTSVSGQERAELNRITLSVSVRYYDRVEDKELLQRSFSSFADYNPLEGGLELEEETARAALENIADDIFTAATSNW